MASATENRRPADGASDQGNHLQRKWWRLAVRFCKALDIEWESEEIASPAHLASRGPRYLGLGIVLAIVGVVVTVCAHYGWLP